VTDFSVPTKTLLESPILVAQWREQSVPSSLAVTELANDVHLLESDHLLKRQMVEAAFAERTERMWV